MRGTSVAARRRSSASGATSPSFHGDGFLAYFGYPVGHDDSPERGTRAGIAILDALELVNQRLERQHGIRLAVRIAIHTGDVVIGEGGGKDAEVFGEAVHLAARVQQLARPNEVLVTETTCRLVSGLFVMEERGSHALRGIAKPVSLYRVLQPTGARGRLQASGVHGLTPFVGREPERSLLLNRWQRAQEGEGQVVLVTGEPGIGKSRLVQVFRDDIAGHAQAWVECATSSYHANTPFFCVIEMIQQGLSRQCGESPEQRLVFLERALTTTGLDPREGVPLLAGLIGLSSASGALPADRRLAGASARAPDGDARPLAPRSGRDSTGGAGRRGPDVGRPVDDRAARAPGAPGGDGAGAPAVHCPPGVPMRVATAFESHHRDPESARALSTCDR